METLWFWLVAVMIAGYVVLDGFDIGAGMVHLLAAKTDNERRQVLASIGPVWDGNEVWLLAAGGTLYFAFPKLYASSFSGFYLPLMMVLWLLILRGISIEFRNHIQSPAWTPMWDLVFAGASTLLAVFFGAALGNVVRGVPLDRDGDFFLPLWTNFLPGAQPGILDWYTILVGVTAAATLLMHGSLWVAYKTEADLHARARAIARRVVHVVTVLTVGLTAASFSIQPQIPASFGRAPWGYVFPALTLVGLFLVLRNQRAGNDLRAFLGSGVFIVGMLTSAAFGLFPMVLPSNTDPALSLTVQNTAAARYGLGVGLMWWIPGMLLALGYAFFLYRRFAGKVPVAGTSHGH
jgi:cytochrome bd ubiquinol oxidase subunit II